MKTGIYVCGYRVVFSCTFNLLPALSNYAPIVYVEGSLGVLLYVAEDVGHMTAACICTPYVWIAIHYYIIAMSQNRA